MMGNRAFVVGDVAFSNPAAIARLEPGKAGDAQAIEFLDLPPAVIYRVSYNGDNRFLTDPIEVHRLARQLTQARVSVIPVVA